MAVAHEVTDLTTVEEEIRSAYVEKDGKHILDVERYAEIKAKPLVDRNKKLLDEKKQLEEKQKTIDQKSKSTSEDIDKQLKEKDDRIAALEMANREHEIWDPVRGLAAKYGVMGDRLDAVMTLLRAQNRFDLEDKTLVFRDKNGNPTNIKPERAFEVYLREELPWAFEASKAAGSGAQNGGKGSPGQRTLTRESFEAMTQAQKDAFMADHAKGIARLID